MLTPNCALGAYAAPLGIARPAYGLGGVVAPYRPLGGVVAPYRPWAAGLVRPWASPLARPWAGAWPYRGLGLGVGACSPYRGLGLGVGACSPYSTFNTVGPLTVGAAAATLL